MITSPSSCIAISSSNSSISNTRICTYDDRVYIYDTAASTDSDNVCNYLSNTSTTSSRRFSHVSHLVDIDINDNVITVYNTNSTTSSSNDDTSSLWHYGIDSNTLSLVINTNSISTSSNSNTYDSLLRSRRIRFDASVFNTTTTITSTSSTICSDIMHTFNISTNTFTVTTGIGVDHYFYRYYHYHQYYS